MKHFFSSVEDILYTLDEGCHMLLNSGWRGTECVNYFFQNFSFIILQIS